VFFLRCYAFSYVACLYCPGNTVGKKDVRFNIGVGKKNPRYIRSDGQLFLTDCINNNLTWQHFGLLQVNPEQSSDKGRETFSTALQRRRKGWNGCTCVSVCVCVCVCVWQYSLRYFSIFHPNQCYKYKTEHTVSPTTVEMGLTWQARLSAQR